MCFDMAATKESNARKQGYRLEPDIYLSRGRGPFLLSLAILSLVDGYCLRKILSLLCLNTSGLL